MFSIPKWVVYYCFTNIIILYYIILYYPMYYIVLYNVCMILDCIIYHIISYHISYHIVLYCGEILNIISRTISHLRTEWPASSLHEKLSSHCYSQSLDTFGPI